MIIDYLSLKTFYCLNFKSSISIKGPQIQHRRSFLFIKMQVLFL